jgi:hypothetical protein
MLSDRAPGKGVGIGIELGDEITRRKVTTRLEVRGEDRPDEVYPDKRCWCELGGPRTVAHLSRPLPDVPQTADAGDQVGLPAFVRGTPHVPEGQPGVGPTSVLACASVSLLLYWQAHTFVQELTPSGGLRPAQPRLHLGRSKHHHCTGNV